MDTQIEEIKNKIDIVEFIGSYVDVKKSGRNFKACCPFHQEKSPSFVISPDRQIWHCFGACGEGGDIIKFLMKWDNLTFFEALKELADKAGVKLESVNFEDKEWNQKERIIKMHYLASEFYQYILHQTPFGKKALEYLAGRGINERIMKTFGIGYSPSSWDSLLKFLKKKGFKEYEIEEAGLVVKSDRGSYYDRFRGRLMFPIKDIKGNIIAFSGRLLDSTDKTAKYVNSPETPIYHKRESLFGIHLTKDAIRKANNVYLVEGEFDMITPYQHGVENIVVVKGSIVTKDQLMILKRYTSRITLMFDADEAGQEAIRRGINEADKLDLEIHVVHLDNGKDPDEAIKADPITFKKNIQNTLPIYDFLIDLSVKKHPGKTAFDKKNIGDEMIPYIASIKNPIVQSHYVKVLAQLLEVGEDSIKNSIIKHYRKAKPQPTAFAKKVPVHEEPREEMMEKYVMSYILQSEDPYATSDQVFSVFKPEDFTLPFLQKIAQAFIDFKNKGQGTFDMQKFSQALPSELKASADEIYLFASNALTDVTPNIQKVAVEVKKNNLKHRIQLLLKDDSDSPDKEKELSNLSNALKEVEKSLKTV